MRVWLLPWTGVGDTLYEMEVPDEEQPVLERPEWFMEVPSWLDMTPAEDDEKSLGHMGVIYLSESIPNPLGDAVDWFEEIDWRKKGWNGTK